MSWICQLLLRESKIYMFRRASRSLTRFWLVRKTGQVQHNMSHCGIPRFCICRRENRICTSPFSSTSTLVEHGGVVGKWIMQLSKHVSVSELANTKDLLQRQNSVVIPWYNTYFWNLLIAVLDPIDRVQPRSKTTLVGKFQKNWSYPSKVSWIVPRSRWRIVRAIRIPIAWFPGMTLTLFNGFFRGWKSWLWISTFLALTFLIIALAFVWIKKLLEPFSDGLVRNPPFRKLSLPFEKPFLPRFPLDHQTLSSFDRNSVFCCCSSPRNALPVPFDPLLPFPFPFLFNFRVLNDLDRQAYSLLSHVQKHDPSSSS